MIKKALNPIFYTVKFRDLLKANKVKRIANFGSLLQERIQKRALGNGK